MVQSYGRRLGGDHDHGSSGSGGDSLSPQDLTASNSLTDPGGVTHTGAISSTVEASVIRNDTAQTVTSGSIDDISFDTVQEDELGGANLSNNEITLPTGGDYILTCLVTANGGGNSFSANDVLVSRFQRSNNANFSDTSYTVPVSTGAAVFDTFRYSGLDAGDGGISFQIRFRNAGSIDADVSVVFSVVRMDQH